jgi:hypothetical protein
MNENIKSLQQSIKTIQATDEGQSGVAAIKADNDAINASQIANNFQAVRTYI